MVRVLTIATAVLPALAVFTPVAREGNVGGTNRAKGVAGRQTPPLPTVSRGAEHGCGLSLDGRAYCWGSNRLGQLGDDRVGDDRVAGVARNAASAVAVATPRSFVAISAGANHTCALTADGEAYCWGLNLTGELAQALVANECDGFPCSRRPVQVESGVRFDTLSAGFGHTCALSDGRAFCWGRNDRGQVGTARSADVCGGIACTVSPTLVGGVTGFTAISSGGDHTCGMAAGAAYCWGSNQYGQLGVSATARSSSRPLRVTAADGLVSIEAKGIRTCGRTAAGAETCWGAGVSGAP
jgi:alpha-tubulin suppressor-like RCC1 family protein